ncbi:hypothetical protein D3C80_746820 [compost metagenome]
MREYRIGTDFGDTEAECPGFVDGAADHFGTDPLGHRHRFAGDHAFIHIRGTFDDLTVDRDLLARANEHDITGGHLVERDFQGFTVTLDARRFGLQPNQPFYRLRGSPLGASLQRAPKQNQRNDHRGGFEIDVGGTLRQHLRNESGHHRVAISRRGTHRHQRVHVRGTAQQCRHALAEEAQAGPKQHQRGKHELQIRIALFTQNP